MRNKKTYTAKKIVLILLSLILCACALMACEGQNKSKANSQGSLDSELVGTWHEDMYDSGYIFNADGTGTDTFWDLEFTYTILGTGKLHIVYKEETCGETDYVYAIENKTLKMTLASGGLTTEYTKK